MGWWTSAVALQGEAANHPELLRSRAVVVSVRGARRALSASGMGQEDQRERSTDDVSKSALDDIEAGRPTQPGMSLAGVLLIGGGVRHGGGVSLVRALVWNVGTCRLAPAGGQWRQHGPAVAGGRESLKRLIREGSRADAGHRGGPDRSSCEGCVTNV
jgi:hypothetical protein